MLNQKAKSFFAIPNVICLNRTLHAVVFPWLQSIYFTVVLTQCFVTGTSSQASTFDNDRGSGEGSGGVDHNYYAGGGK